MRSIGPAGWGSHGYFGEHAKTFGNPTGASSGDGGVPPPSGAQNVVAGDVTFGRSTYLLTGFSGLTTSTAVRANASFVATASQADTDLPAPFANSVQQAFNGTNRFVVIDGNTNIGSSPDGVTWTLALISGSPPNSPFGVTYDDANERWMYVDTSARVWSSADAVELSFATECTFPAGAPEPPIAYKQSGTGITLCCGGGNTIFKSTDASTFTSVGTIPFGGGTIQFLGFGATGWVAIGAGSDGAVQFSRSTDDGTTWSAPADLPGANNTSSGFVVAATNHVDEWFVGNQGSPPPDNYWVSHDDGQTWSSPNTFSTPAWDAVCFGSSGFSAICDDPAQTFTFLATSGDGVTWTEGPNVTEPG